MKKSITFACFLVSSFFLFGQKNKLKLDLTNLSANTFAVNYERHLNEKWSINGGVGYFNKYKQEQQSFSTSDTLNILEQIFVEPFACALTATAFAVVGGNVDEDFCVHGGNNITQINQRGMVFSGGLRYYPIKEIPGDVSSWIAGLYIESDLEFYFYKHSKVTASEWSVYLDNGNRVDFTNTKVGLRERANTALFLLQLGCQWKLWNKILIEPSLMWTMVMSPSADDRAFNHNIGLATGLGKPRKNQYAGMAVKVGVAF